MNRRSRGQKAQEAEEETNIHIKIEIASPDSVKTASHKVESALPITTILIGINIGISVRRMGPPSKNGIHISRSMSRTYGANRQRMSDNVRRIEKSLSGKEETDNSNIFTIMRTRRVGIMFLTKKTETTQLSDGGYAGHRALNWLFLRPFLTG
jgi:hypothetical protein